MKRPHDAAELIRRLAQEKQRKQLADGKTGNALANSQHRWVRFQHYVWDRKKGG